MHLTGTKYMVECLLLVIYISLMETPTWKIFSDIGLKPILCHLALKGTVFLFFPSSLLVLFTQTKPLVQQVHKNYCNSENIFL